MTYRHAVHEALSEITAAANSGAQELEIALSQRDNILGESIHHSDPGLPKPPREDRVNGRPHHLKLPDYWWDFQLFETSDMPPARRP